jgi:hypothetical protein
MGGPMNKLPMYTSFWMAKGLRTKGDRKITALSMIYAPLTNRARVAGETLRDVADVAAMRLPSCFVTVARTGETTSGFVSDPHM